jgi:hypothetical protein
MFNVEFKFHIWVSIDQIIHIILHKPNHSMATHSVSDFSCLQVDTYAKAAYESYFSESRTEHHDSKIP